MHYPGVIRVVYHLCGDSHVAQDAAQETFLRAWQHLPAYRPQGTLRSWLYRIAVNAALDMLRREAKLDSQDIDALPLADHEPGPEASFLAGEQAALVQQAVNALPPASRAVLVLREYQGLSYQEIAAALDIPLGTVMSRLYRGRRLLEKALLSFGVRYNYLHERPHRLRSENLDMDALFADRPTRAEAVLAH